MKRTQESNTAGPVQAAKKVHRDTSEGGAQIPAQPQPCVAAGGVTPANLAGWTYPPLPVGMMPPVPPFCFPGMPAPFFNPFMPFPFWMPAAAAAAGAMMSMPGAVMASQSCPLPAAAMAAAVAAASGAAVAPAMFGAACAAQQQPQPVAQQQLPVAQQPVARPQASGSSFCAPAAAPSVSCGSLQSDACAKPAPAAAAGKACASEGGSPSISTSNDAADEEFSFFIDNFLGTDAAAEGLDLGLASDCSAAVTRVDSIFDFFEDKLNSADDAFVTL